MSIQDKVKFIVSSAPSSLTAANPAVTVEAEYGDAVVSGSLLTMAHHGPRKGQKCPCRYEPSEIPALPENAVVGLSHFDLDTLGGCLAVLGTKPEAPMFWEAAEFVDLNGAHKLRSEERFADVLSLFDAWWAWNTANKVFAPRDGSCLDVTAHVQKAGDVLTRILGGDEELLAAGRKFRAEEDKLNRESLVESRGGVQVRVAGSFVNHLYSTVGGEVGVSVVAYNTSFGSVTVSFSDADAIGTRNAREIVQGLWGELAGGHDCIAGSPRGTRMSLEDFNRCVNAVVESLQS